MKTLLVYALLILASLFCQTCFAQKKNILPVDNPACNNCLGIKTPPSTPVRAMAEWEELEAIALTFSAYKDELSEIICAAKEEVIVYVITSLITLEEDTNRILEYCTDLDNIVFLQIPHNGVWIRDYGPNSVYANEVDSLYFIDWIYDHADQLLADCIPGKLGEQLNIPTYLTVDSTATPPNDLLYPGGNFIPDGMGGAFASNLLWDENGVDADYCVKSKNNEEIRTVLEQFTGTNRLMVLEKLPFDRIHHVDMSMKLLDEETLLIGEFPPNTPDGVVMEQNVQYIQEHFKTPYDNDYKIIRIPMPPCEDGDFQPLCGNLNEYPTYTNALFVNNSILVPTYAIPMDEIALQVWQEAKPGYKIIGIDSRAISKGTGAVHCVTKEIGTSNPLWITLEKVKRGCVNEPTTITAKVKHRTGVATVSLFYRAETGGVFQELPMLPSTNDMWSAEIPPFPDGTDIQYYIHATANSGKQINRPIPAPEAFLTFPTLNCAVNTRQVNNELFTLNKAYPNPASNLIFLEFDLRIPATLSLYNAVGIPLKQMPLQPLQTNLFIPLHDLPRGLYYYQITSEKGTLSHEKLIIER